MNCIFCKEQTTGSSSVEHIIPESLGNKEFILEKGWVCDKCNNYFAIKIEQQLLQIPFFLQNRHDLDIKSKRKKIPSKNAFLLDENNTQIKFKKDKNAKESIEINNDDLEQLVEAGIQEIASIDIVFGPPFNNEFVSKFLGKIGIEFLAFKANAQGFDESYYNQDCLDNIKRYVRKGGKNEVWPYTVRQIYNPEYGLEDENGYFKIISTWAYILTADNQLLFQFLFVGTEFTIDLINPNTLSVEQWFRENNNKSVVFENIKEKYNIN